MDTTILVNNLKVVFDALRIDGIDIEYVALSPAYAMIPNSTYKLMVASPNLKEMSLREMIHIISSKLYALLDTESLRRLDRVAVYENRVFLEENATNGMIDQNICESILSDNLELV